MNNRNLLKIILMLPSIHCSNNDINIVAKKENIIGGEIFCAKIYAPIHDSSIYPQFYIIQNKIDTHMLLIDNTKGYGIFKAVGRTKGQNKYGGFVKYIDKNGNYKKKDFVIVFNVK